MAKITPKDNFMKLVNGGHPEYVPVFTMMGWGYMDEMADTMMGPQIFGETHFTDGGKDMWGVPYSASEGTANATMPDTRFTLLPDIDDWKDIIKPPANVPKPNEIDWEALYEKDLKMLNVDRTRTAVKTGPGFMPFQQLVAMMGFTEGLMALMTDPETVSDMLNYMVDFLEPYFSTYIDYYKPDLWYMLDDTCAKEMPFFSPATYKQVFKPIYERLAKPANDRGIPIIFHNCGRIDDFLDDMVDFGVTLTDPAQQSNDIPTLKEKYKGKLSFCGGWDWSINMPKNYPEYDEEELRQTVRDAIDKNSVGGAYAWCGAAISYPGDPVVDKINLILRDEAHWYGRKVYGYKD